MSQQTTKTVIPTQTRRGENNIDIYAGIKNTNGTDFSHWENMKGRIVYADP